MKASQLCVFALILIAATVAILQYAKKNAWPWIVLYWVVLTAKNICDWMGW